MSLILLITLSIFSALTMPVLAQEDTEKSSSVLKRLETAGGQIQTEGTTPDLASTIGGVIRAIISFVGAVFMIYIVYGGWLWLTAAGNDEKIKKAKDIIRGSIIGLIIVLAAYLITATVIQAVISKTGYKTA